MQTLNQSMTVVAIHLAWLSEGLESGLNDGLVGHESSMGYCKAVEGAIVNKLDSFPLQG
ncbi:MAG: hypothetical protein R3F41_06515 [Gammaproteobacteria bacterium]|nr:hypothetical protein [Pseudomonadales bacterium]MCP5348569.1 hypothetical protein [Pseudomonadales bacterium]